MQKILLSACLSGLKVRYDGKDNLITNNWLQSLEKKGLILPICPEIAGGLPVPRPAAEIQADGTIKTIYRADVTDAFAKGAQTALNMVNQHRIKIAILKARSPSCGNETIYDGTFTKNRIKGMGVTAKLLHENGVLVFNEDQLEAAQQAYNNLFII